MKTLKRQTSLFTTDKSISSQEDSHASHTHRQAKDWGKKTSDTSGRRCLERLQRLNQLGSWAKTFTALLIGMEGWSSRRCKLTWKLKGTKYNRIYFQLRPSTLPISDTVFGLLPTPLASDATTGAIIGKNDTYRITSTGMPRKINQKGTDGSVGLARLGIFGMLPTPRANKVNGCNLNSETLANRNKGNLEESIAKWETQMLPTPASQDGKNATFPKSQIDRDTVPGAIVRYGAATRTFQLNPRFVAEMMGFPPDWTELPFQNGETNRSKDTETQ